MTYGCARAETPPPSAPVEPTAQPQPDPEPTAAAVDAACAAIRARVEAELCGGESDCDAGELPCTQRLDLDGDGKDDEVAFADDDGQSRLRVSFGDGSTVVLTEPFELAELPDLDQPWPAPSDERYPSELSWLVAWSVAKRDGDVLVRGSRFRAGPALGDGLWMSGTDAAAMLMRTERGWLLVELGY